MVEFYSFHQNADILDSGRGYGKNNRYILEKSFSIYGVDISKTAIKQAKIILKDFFYSRCKMSFKNKFFDVIVDGGCFHVNFSLSRGNILNEYYRALKKWKIIYRIV